MIDCTGAMLLSGRMLRSWHGGCLHTYSMLRNSASGQEIGLQGWILAGLLPGKHRKGPSGRPAGRWAYFGPSPLDVRQKSGPDGRFPARKHYGVTSSIVISIPTSRVEGRRPSRPRPGMLLTIPGIVPPLNPIKTLLNPIKTLFKPY